MRIVSRAGLLAGLLVGLLISGLSLSGCWVVAAGAGAETAYVATQEDRSAGETLTDQRISSTVKTKLVGSDKVKGFDIDVDTFRSVVTLRGYVRSREEELEAISLAQSVDGVKQVESKMVVE